MVIMGHHNQTERILTAKEIAREWKVSHSKIYRLAKAGELKSYRIGGSRRFKESDVWAFFENQVAPEYVSWKER